MTTNIVDNGVNTDKVNTKYEKLAVCITFHYVKERLQYLKTVCEFLVDIAPIVNLTIVTNVTDQEKIKEIELLINKEKIHLEFLKPYGLGHPYLLAWSHLEVFRKKILDASYTHFLYVEDDIKITRQNIAYWLEARELLKGREFIPGFFRIEQNNLDGDLYSTDVMQKMSVYDCPVIRINENNTFVGITYPFQGLYFFDRELMEEHLSGPTSCPDFDHSDGGVFRTISHDLRARAAFGLTFYNVHKGFRSRYLLPYNKITGELKSDCLVHHLPNNYTNNPNSTIAKIKLHEIFLPKSANTYLRNKVKLIAKSIVEYFLN